MKQNTLRETVTQTISVASLADQYKVTRQMMYNYIDMYDNGDYKRIREDVFSGFQRIMKIDPTNFSRECVLSKEVKELLEEMNGCKYSIKLIEKEIEEKDELKNHFMTNETEKETLKTTIDDLQKKKTELLSKLDKIKIRYSEKYTELRNMQISEPAEHIIERLAEEGRYGGPSWVGTGLNTACVADSGDYMVFIDFDPTEGRTELNLYAVIGGERVFIAKYRFNENERFVKFSLIPKLTYYYEVVSKTDVELFKSGIIELKNYV